MEVDEYDASVEEIDQSDKKRARGPDQLTPEAVALAESKALTEEKAFDDEEDERFALSKAQIEEKEFEEEEDERFAQSKKDSRRKRAARERRKRLFKAGIRFYVYSSGEDDDEQRRIRTKDREHRLELSERPYSLEPGEPVPDWLSRWEHNNEVFNGMKESGEYRKQHWHMTETSERGPKQYLIFRFPDPIWDIYYGDSTNILPNTMQIYSLKLITHEENYPLSVFGELRMHCVEDFGAQVIFSRDIDHCQTITKEEPYLLLTGPYCNPKAPPLCNELIEADLILKGNTRSDDRYLSLFAQCDEKMTANRKIFRGLPDVQFNPDDQDQSHVSECCEKNGKPCICNHLKIGSQYVLEMTRGIVTHSVVANIYVLAPQNVSLTDSYYFTAWTEESCDDMKVVLLDCRDGKENPILDKHTSTFVLSRQTICVDKKRILKVYIEQNKRGEEFEFVPQLDGKEERNVIGSSTLQVIVEWSVYWEKYDSMIYREPL